MRDFVFNENNLIHKNNEQERGFKLIVVKCRYFVVNYQLVGKFFIFISFL